jgi:diacylglycerol kinase family enzyme
VPQNPPGRSARIPAFVNPGAGSAGAARAAIAGDPRFELRQTAPDALPDALRAAAGAGARRVLVAGGDGTITTAAAALARSPVEIAILPGGTLNHFARDHGIPTEPAAALELAASGAARGIDAGEVNGLLFLNTSSVGAYVAYVRVRERLEPWFGYRISGVLATIRIFAGLRGVDAVIEANGVEARHHTPLVFVGLGERQLRLPGFGRRDPDGRRGLHVVIVRGRTRARIVALAIEAAARGFHSSTSSPTLESSIVEGFRIELPRLWARVAVDGEIDRSPAPLVYRLLRDHVRVVTGPDGAAARAPRGDGG